MYSDVDNSKNFQLKFRCVLLRFVQFMGSPNITKVDIKEVKTDVV